jgi:hypothetical protein
MLPRDTSGFFAAGGEMLEPAKSATRGIIRNIFMVVV